MKLFGSFWNKKSKKSNNEQNFKIHSHLAEYLEFLMPFFVDYDDVRDMFKFKNKPNNLNGVLNFALFLDITTNLPNIFDGGYSSKELTNIVNRYVKSTVNALHGLSVDFGENEINQATERIMRYINLLISDLKKHNAPNYQSITDFLKEVFSGKITEEEKKVLTNMLASKLPAIFELVWKKIQLIKPAPTSQHEFSERRQKKIRTKELGEKYCLLVLDRTKKILEDDQLMKDLGISRTNDSVREIHIINMFSIFNCIKSVRLDNDIIDSIVYYIIDSYVDFLIEHAQNNGIDEEQLLPATEDLRKLITKRFNQYYQILKKYETHIQKNDNPDNAYVALDIANDLVKIMNNITFHKYDEDNLFNNIHYFSFFMEVIMDKDINDTINSDVDEYEIYKSQFSDEIQRSIGDEYKVTKKEDGSISIARDGQNFKDASKSSLKKGFFMSDFVCEKCGGSMLILRQQEELLLICSYHQDVCGKNICSNKKLLSGNESGGFTLTGRTVKVNTIDGLKESGKCQLCGESMISWKWPAGTSLREDNLFLHELGKGDIVITYRLPEARYMKICSNIQKCKNIIRKQ